MLPGLWTAGEGTTWHIRLTATEAQQFVDFVDERS
jgi:hypothetical protein